MIVLIIFLLKLLIDYQMKNIKFLIFLLVLSSCNQYLGSVDPDYNPKNQVTEIFSNTQDYSLVSNVYFGNIIYPKTTNHSVSMKNLNIEKVIKTDKNSIVNFLDDKIILSKDEKVYVIDESNENNIFEYKLNLHKDENVHHIFLYNEGIFILTNRSRIFNINGEKLNFVANFEIFTNTAPLINNNILIIFSVFEELYEINLDNFSALKKDSFSSKSSISVKANTFEDQENLYYLYNAETLITLDKSNFSKINNYILDDLNILSSLGVFNELVDSPFSYNDYLYFLDRSGKISVFNPFSSDILWELDINETILSYLFSEDGYLILLTFDKILILSNDGYIINIYNHDKKSPILLFNIQEKIYLISKEGISKLNLNEKNEEKFYKNKFTSNLDIYYYKKNIYLKDNKSLFKLSE